MTAVGSCLSLEEVLGASSAFITQSGMGAQFLLERKHIPQRFSVWSIESWSDLGTVRLVVVRRGRGRLFLYNHGRLPAGSTKGGRNRRSGTSPRGLE